MKKEIKIIHVVLQDGSHHYFGSIAAIYQKFDKSVIGVSMKTLYNYNIESEKPFTNKKCIIYKGALVQKLGNRFSSSAKYQEA